MKFSEMKYERPDIQALVALCDEVTAKIEAADCAKDQIKAYEDAEKQFIHAMTMSSIAYVRHTINTKDEFYAAEKAFFNENGPLLGAGSQKMSLALLNSKFRPELEEHFGSLVFKNLEISVRTFTPENIPLMQEENKLTSDYQQLYASAAVEWEGETLPLPMLGKYKLSPDREIRKRAYEKEGEFFDSHRAEFDEIYDKLVKIRNQQARNLGHKNYIQLGYDNLGRNCYGYDDLVKFRKQIHEDMVPLTEQIKAKQRERIGVEQIELYDDNFVFPEGNATPTGTADEILAAGREMYRAMSPETAEFIDFMYDNELLDVLSKDGKAPGGYCTQFAEYGAPFIFSNFNGTSGDVDVLTHEAGHAFAAFRAFKNDIPNMLKDPTIEACEVHSMSMEFLTQDHHEKFFGDKTPQYEYEHCASALTFIPYGCMVDEFQHLMYENEELTPEERNQVWLGLEKKYRPYLSLGDLPFYGRGAGWQRQLHIYIHPLYYIDYCMAQTVALTFWVKFLEDKDAAWKSYLGFVDLAGTKTFEQLVHSVGMKLPYDNGAIKEIAEKAFVWLKENEI